MEDFKSQFTDLNTRLDLLAQKLLTDEKKARRQELDQRVIESGFWGDAEAAGKLSQELGDLNKEAEMVDGLAQRLQDAIELSGSEDAEVMQDELASEIRELTKELDQLELQPYLSGKYDTSGAIVSLHAGQGGTEAMDWTEMLFRMYLRYAEKQEIGRASCRER